MLISFCLCVFLCVKKQVEGLFCFDPADTLTWSAAASALGHVHMVGTHAKQVLEEAAAAHDGSQHANHNAREGSEEVATPPPPPRQGLGGEPAAGSAAADAGEGWVDGFSPWEEEVALLEELRMRTAALLTEAALCMSMALSRFDRAQVALPPPRSPPWDPRR